MIEDDPASLRLLAYVLRRWGHFCLEAADGESGLALAASQPPDLVFCDIGLPGIDGYQVLAGLRSQAANAATPVVAVTAYAMLGDREKVLAHGFSEYLAKPVDPRTLLAVVEQWTGTGGQDGAHPDRR